MAKAKNKPEPESQGQPEGQEPDKTNASAGAPNANPKHIGAGGKLLRGTLMQYVGEKKRPAVTVKLGNTQSRIYCFDREIAGVGKNLCIVEDSNAVDYLLSLAEDVDKRFTVFVPEDYDRAVALKLKPNRFVIAKEGKGDGEGEED